MLPVEGVLLVAEACGVRVVRPLGAPPASSGSTIAIKATAAPDDVAAGQRPAPSQLGPGALGVDLALDHCARHCAQPTLCIPVIHDAAPVSFTVLRDNGGSAGSASRSLSC